MKKLVTTCVLLSAIVLAGCTPKEADSGAEISSQLDKLVLTYVTSPLNVPTIIEKERELLKTAFQGAGTQVEYAEINSGADQTQALASGDVHILNAVGATSVVLSAANGGDIKVLSMYSRSPKAFAMYSKDETLVTPESLRGKTIAGPVGTNLHQLLIAYLDAGNMTIDDVNYVNMGIPDAKAGLDGGSVDVALIAGATAYTAKEQGYHMVADGEGYIDALIAVAVTGAFYEANKAAVDTFVKTQGEIANFMLENKQETIEIVAKALDLEEKAVEEMMELYDFSTAISQEDIDGLQRTADFMLDAGMIEENVEMEALILN